MRKLIAAALVIALGLCCLQCSDSTSPTPPEPGPTDPTDGRTLADLTDQERDLARTSNEFGLSLFREVLEEASPDSNVMVSPLSVTYALGMTCNGAAGETYDAMRTTMCQQGMTQSTINESYDGLTDILVSADAMVKFSIANSIWYRLGKGIVPAFIETSQTYFDARVEEVDFQQQSTVDTINVWVDENTNGKIKEILKPPVSPDLAMILINAIYFKGSWTFPFDPDSTKTLPFYTAAGHKVDCQMMCRDASVDTTLSYPYFDNALFQAVDLPYSDGTFSMTVMLPTEGHTVDNIISELTPENWDSWRTSFYDADIPLMLPKFKFAFGDTLNQPLIDLGMGIAFDATRADFSNMFADGIGWIDRVIHKTFIQVDEEGTEAAAVTAVMMFDTAIRGMIVDRPFLFIIHEHESGTILFMGRVAEPTWEDEE